MLVNDLQGKVCLITGASRGIGAAIARSAAQRGAAVAVNYLNSDKQAAHEVEAIRRMGARAIAVGADVSSPAGVDKLFLQVEQELGPVDLLVNNAGRSLQKLVTHTSDNEWDETINTNLKGPFLCCRRALPHMIRQHSGRIVNIASIWGMAGASCESIYAASKGGLVLFTRSLAKEVGPSGITVNAIAPGPVDTDMLRGELSTQECQDLAREIPLGRLGCPEEVASLCVYLLGESASYITGQVIAVDGGWTC